MKPWWKLIRPRQDIIDSESMDLGQYAIHLDQVAAKSKDCPEIYREPDKFFATTVFTRGLVTLSSHVAARLTGDVQAPSVINLTTPFGGGKSHALALLYHLYNAGNDAKKMVPRAKVDDPAQALLSREIPKARVVVWVGTNYAPQKPDANGMTTPWGQILGQISPKAADMVRPFDQSRSRPDQDSIREMLDTANAPVLLLIDEVISAAGVMRATTVGETTLASQFRHFYMGLSNVAASRTGVVIVNSFSKSRDQVDEEDQGDLQMLLNVAGRLDAPIETATGDEIPRIIRHRLFEPIEDPRIENDIKQTIREWVDWTVQNQPNLTIDREMGRLSIAHEASYPFHPRVLQLFESKWSGLPSYGRTRGTLRMLSLWIRDAYLDAVKKGSKESIITLGQAPLQNTKLANVVYRQLGNETIGVAVRTDITGPDAHAVLLAADSKGKIKEANLHVQVATAVFMESAGGQAGKRATDGEIRYAVAGPDIDTADVVTCLTDLEKRCYHLRHSGSHYWMSPEANLVKILNTEKASTPDEAVLDEVHEAIGKEIGRSDFRIFPMPAAGADVPDRPHVALIVVPPEVVWNQGPESREAYIRKFVGKEQTRKFRRHVVFLSPNQMVTELFKQARIKLTYERIKKNASQYELDKSDAASLPGLVDKARDALGDLVWQVYRQVTIVAADGKTTERSLGLIHRSMTKEGLAKVVEGDLLESDVVTKALSSRRVLEHWPPAFKEAPWNLMSLRDAIFQSEEFTRIIDERALAQSIITWVDRGDVALVELDADGKTKKVLAAKTTRAPGIDEVEFKPQVGVVRQEDLVLPTPTTPAPTTANPLAQTAVATAQPENVPVQTAPGAAAPAGPGSIRLVLRVPVRKISSISAQLVNFDATDVRIVVEGKPKTGALGNPIADLKDAVKKAGGAVEEG